MSIIADRVRETTQTIGTGAVSLAGAQVGFQSFSAAFISGTVVDYCITDGTNWEVGSGTVTTGAPWTLSRATIYASSSANGLVNFPAGTKDVFCTLAASQAVTKTTLSNGTLPVVGTSGNFTSTLGYTNGLLVNGKLNHTTTEGTATNGQNRLAAAVYSIGKKLNPDETFLTGVNNILVYDNLASGLVTITRIASTGLNAPNNSGFVVQIQHTGSATSPGYGGFTFMSATRANSTLSCVFKAKLPVGYTLNFATNPTGTGGTNYWATDNIGTGKWEDYVYIIRCGDSGTFNNTNYFYITGTPAPTAIAPLTWYLSSATVYDLDDRVKSIVIGTTQIKEGETVASLAGLTNVSSSQLTSTVATGTPPLVITSTTPVPNLSIGGNAATATAVNGGAVNATDGTFSGMLKLTNTGANLYMDSPGFSTLGIKKITCNDGAGNWNLRAGVYYNTAGANTIYEMAASGGATQTFNFEGTAGAISWTVYPVSVNAGDVATTSTAMSFTTNGLTLSGGSFISTVATGTAPLVVSSATPVTGLNTTGYSRYLSSPDGTRNAADKLPTTSAQQVRYDFSTGASAGNPGSLYAGVMTYAPWLGTTASTGSQSYQMSYGSNIQNTGTIPVLNVRNGIDSTWNSWYTLLHSGNYYGYTELYADATGTSDAITATLAGAYSTLIDGYRISLGIVTSNTTTTPTFTPTIGGIAQTTRTIVKIIGNTGVALAPGDLQGVADLRYDLPNLRWVLMNPALANATVSNVIGGTVVSSDVQLSAVSKTFLTSNNIIDSYMYDTRKDSDGGAWRKRCTTTSWYNETIYGNYLGEVASEAAARALSSAVTNSYFHNTTNGLFYALNAGSGVTQVYRGNRREFPEVVAITALADRLIIWDLTDSSIPMWKIIQGYAIGTFVADGYSFSATCLSAINGSIIVGLRETATNQLGFYGGAIVLEFITDTINKFSGSAVNTSGSGRLPGVNPIYLYSPAGVPLISNGIHLVNGEVNAVDTMVMPTAPVDIASGLPIPTIIFATAGGVSVVKDDGTVVNLTANWAISAQVKILDRYIFFKQVSSGVAGGAWFRADLTTITNTSIGWFGTSTIPMVTAYEGSSFNTGAIQPNWILSYPSTAGLTLSRAGAMTVSGGAYSTGLYNSISNTYNSGWMPGDIQGAWLADTVAETVTGVSTTNLITGDSSNFTGGTVGGWTLVTGANYATVAQGASIAAVAQQLVITAPAAKAITTITWAAGVATVTCTAHGFTTGQVLILYGNTPTTFNTADVVCTVVDANTFTVPMVTNPGTLTVAGSVCVHYTVANLTVTGLTIGRSYLVTFDNPNNSVAWWRIGNTPTSVEYANITSSGISQSFSLTPTATSINICAMTTSPGVSVVLDNFKCVLNDSALIQGDSSTFNSSLGNWALSGSYWGTAQGVGFTAASGALVTTMVAPLTISTISWATGTVTVVTTTPHLLANGMDVVITGCTPTGYNVERSITVVNATTFTFLLTTDPGVSTVVGLVNGYTRTDLSVTGLTIGASYVLQLNRITSTTNHPFRVGQTIGGTQYYDGYPASGNIRISFIANATTLCISSFINAGSPAGTTSTIDNVTLTLAAADRSVKNNALTVVGTLTKSIVNTGSQLMAYSGFSATSYLEQPYNANLDFGTGDFCIIGWINPLAQSSGSVLHRAQPASGGGILLNFTNTLFNIYLSTSAAWVNALPISGISIPANTFSQIAVVRASGILYFYLNGKLINSVVNTTNLTYINAITRIGNRLDAYEVLGAGTLLRISATAPSADQIAYMYETERKLFEPNTQCTLAGSSSTVTAIDYDEVTDLLHVGTSYGRSVFKGLTRSEAIPATIGTPTIYDTYEGTIIESSASGSKIYIPSKILRDELNRTSEQKKQFGQDLVPQDFTATANQTTFVLPVGFTPKYIYEDGFLKRITTHYTIPFDGFRFSIVFTAGLAVGTLVTIMATRG